MAVICDIIGSIGGCCEAPPPRDSHLLGQSDHWGNDRRRAVLSRRWLALIVFRSVVGRLRSRGIIAIRRVCRSRRSRAGWDAQRRRSRRTCTTHLTLTKGLRKPRRDARRVWRPPAHKADPGLSRAERTPPWRGGASPTPDPVRRSSARQGALLERVREPAVGWQQPPVVRSAQLGDRGRSRPRGRRDYRNRGEAQARLDRLRRAERSSAVSRC